MTNTNKDLFDLSKFAKASDSIEDSIEYHHQIMVGLMADRERIDNEMQIVHKEIELLKEKKKTKELQMEVDELELEVTELERQVNHFQRVEDKEESVMKKALKESVKKNKVEIPKEWNNNVHLMTVDLEDGKSRYYVNVTDYPTLEGNNFPGTPGPISYQNLYFEVMGIVGESFDEGVRRLLAWFNQSYDPQTGESYPLSEIIKSIRLEKIDPEGFVTVDQTLEGCRPIRVDEDWSTADEKYKMEISVDYIKK